MRADIDRAARPNFASVAVAERQAMGANYGTPLLDLGSIAGRSDLEVKMSSERASFPERSAEMDGDALVRL